MADAVVFKFSSEEAKAVAGFLKIMDAQKKIEDQTVKTDRSMTKMKSGMESVVKSLRDVGLATLGISGLNEIFQKGIELLGQYNAGLDAISAKGKGSANALRSFWSTLPGGTAGTQFGEQLLKNAAEFGGMKRGDAAKMIEPIITAMNRGAKDLTDKEKSDILAAVAATSKASRLGLDPRILGEAEKRGASMGYAPGETTALAMQASEKVDNETLQRILQNLTTFKSQELGMALGVAISQTVAPEKQGNTLEELGKVLGPGGDVGEMKTFSAKFKLKGLSPEQKLSMLMQAAIASGDIDKFAAELPQYKLDEAKARGVGAVIKNYALAMSELERLMTSDRAGVVDAAVSDLAARPNMAQLFADEVAAAAADAQAAIGVNVPEAAARSERRTAAGQARLAEGGVAGVDIETGKATETEMFLQFLRETFPASSLKGHEPIPYLPKPDVAIQQNLESVQKQIESIGLPAPGGSSMGNIAGGEAEGEGTLEAAHDALMKSLAISGGPVKKDTWDRFMDSALIMAGTQIAAIPIGAATIGGGGATLLGLGRGGAIMEKINTALQASMKQFFSPKIQAIGAASVTGANVLGGFGGHPKSHVAERPENPEFFDPFASFAAEYGGKILPEDKPVPPWPTAKAKLPITSAAISATPSAPDTRARQILDFGMGGTASETYGHGGMENFYEQPESSIWGAMRANRDAMAAAPFGDVKANRKRDIYGGGKMWDKLQDKGMPVDPAMASVKGKGKGKDEAKGGGTGGGIEAAAASLVAALDRNTEVTKQNTGNNRTPTRNSANN